MNARIGVLLLGLLAVAGVAAAQERYGQLTGEVVDQQGAAMPGVAVTTTNVESGESRTFVTDSDGRWQAPDLNPGRYTVVFELQGFARVERTDISVILGRSFVLNAEMRVGQVSELVQVSGAVAPLVDVRSTLIAHNVTAEEIDRLPKGRSFQSIALAAPSVNQGLIEGGIQVNGASGSENSFTVDGVVTNSLVNGSSRQNTVFDYLQEVQVKTTGISAEFGGALGGVISAVTKSGGNTFRGEGHYYYMGSGLSAGPVNRLVLNPADDRTVSYVQDDKQKDHQNEFGGSLGGPIVRDRLFFFVSASPRIVRQTNEYLFSNGTEPGSIDRKQTVMQLFGKVSGSTSRVNAYGTMLYTPTSTTGVFPAGPYDGIGPQFLATPASGVAVNKTRGWETNQTSTTGNVNILGGGANFVTLRGGYFYDNFKDTDVPETAGVVYRTSAVGLPFAIPASLIGPIGTQNTPQIRVSDKDLTTRGFFNIDYNHSVSAGGEHTFKGGFGYMRTVNDVDLNYPSGYVNVFWNSALRSNVTGITDRGAYGYYEVNEFGTFGKVGADILSLFVQDQWNVSPRLTLNLGVRTENESVPNFATGEKAFEFNMADKLAPRLGASYDVKGDGRLKLYGSWGRYFDWTKYELARGSFGGDYWRIYYRSLDTLDVFNLSTGNKPGRDIWGSSTGFRNRRVNFAGNVDPDIKPMYQDSTSVGAEYQLAANTVFTVHYVHNDLGRTIEDIGALDANGDEAYVIGNPGEFLSEVEAPSGLTPLGQKMPKANRQYDALELGINRRFSNNWFFSANYTLSRLYGNYPGIASSDEIRTPTTGITSPSGQQSAGEVFRQGGNANRAWDIDYLNWTADGTHDVLGRLATDRPHVVKLYGAYSLPRGTQVGAFFYGGSGTPISTYVMTTDQIPVFVNGRGDLGRTPTLTRTDFLVSHELRLAGGQAVRFELNVLNVFNQKTATHIYNQVNRGPSGLPRAASAIDLHGVNLLNGYDYAALLARTPDGANAYEPRFKYEDLFNAGTQGQFSVKFSF